MSERVMDTGRKLDWTVGAVVTLAVGNVATAVWGFYTGSFATVWEFAVAHPWEAAGWSLLFVLIGAIAGLLITMRASARKMSDKDTRREQVDGEAARAAVRTSFSHAPAEAKAMFAACLDRGHVDVPDAMDGYCGDQEFDRCNEGLESFERMGLVTSETLPEDERRWSVTEYGKRFAEDNPTLCATARECLSRFAR